MFGTANQQATSNFPISGAGNTNPMQGGLTGSNLSFGNQGNYLNLFCFSIF